MNKNIVTNIPAEETDDLSDHDPSGDALAGTSTITPGQIVTYRLLLGTLGSDSHTVRGADMFDVLPASVDSYAIIILKRWLCQCCHSSAAVM